jgi:hypothetical protein
MLQDIIGDQRSGPVRDPHGEGEELSTSVEVKRSDSGQLPFAGEFD